MCRRVFFLIKFGAMRKIVIKAAGIACLFAVCTGSYAGAQNKKQIRAAYRAHPPSAVFVELFTYQPKIDRYMRTRQEANAEAMKKDAAIIIAKTVADFNANFNFCPVYYFYDTNAELLLARKFDSILLNKDLAPVNESPVSAGDTTYLIVNYGPAAVSRQNYNTAAAGEKNNLDYGVGNNAMINSYKGNILDYTFNPLPPFVLYDKKFFLRSGSNYSYTSRKFNISYKDFAGYLNEKAGAFYRP